MKHAEVKRLINLSNYEDELLTNGFEYIAGVDEVGRGSLAGPIVAAAVILDKKKMMIENLNDSKEINSEKRKHIFKKILDSCIDWSIAKISPNEIDKISINNANVLVIKKAIKKLKIKPDIILVDSIYVDIDIEVLPVKDGDKLCASIAAASIIAKVTRDKIMVKLSKYYPEYGFNLNKGYGTREHLMALQKYGPCTEHRMSFRGVLN